MDEEAKILVWVKTITTNDGSKKQRKNREGTYNDICIGKEPAHTIKKIKLKKKRPHNFSPKQMILSSHLAIDFDSKVYFFFFKKKKIENIVCS